MLGYFSSLPEALDSVIFFPHDSGWSLYQSQVGFLEGQDPIAPVQCLAQRGHAHLEEHLPPHSHTHTQLQAPQKQPWALMEEQGANLLNMGRLEGPDSGSFSLLSF